MVTVIVKKIEDLNESDIAKVLDYLSERGRIRLNKKNNPALRRASLCALSLLEPDQLADLAYTDEGAPSFAALDNHISISHSNTLAAVAISSSASQRVGVDVEDIATRAANPTRQARFLTESEQSLIDRGTSYLEIWTKKEALFKHLGIKDSSPLGLDSARATQTFTTVSIDNSLLTVCTDGGVQIEIIQK